MERAALGALGLARKAGAVVLGFAKVEAAIAGKALAGLVEASDAAANGRAKIARALKARYGEHAPPVIDLFTSAQLDLALGRTNVIHAALLADRASRSFLDRAERLARFRGHEPRQGTLDTGKIGPATGARTTDGIGKYE